MLSDFFKENPKPPFYYQFVLNSIECENELFDVLKKLFLIGICFHFNISILNLHCINEDHIAKISEYLLSLGVKIYCKSFDYEDLHLLYEEVLKDVENIDDVDLIKSIDHRTNLIQKLNIVSNINNLDSIKNFNNILDKHYILNYFEKWYTPSKLRDFYIPIEIKKYQDKKKCKCSIIYFDYFNNYSFLDYK